MNKSVRRRALISSVVLVLGALFALPSNAVAGKKGTWVSQEGDNQAYEDCYQPCADAEQRCLHACGDGPKFTRECGQKCVDTKIACNKKCTADTERAKRQQR